MLNNQRRINFYFQRTCSSLTKRRILKEFIKSMFKKEKTNLSELNYVFCTDKYLLGINQRFLNHDFYSDIVSFNLAGRSMPVQGEIYISVERVMYNARHFRIPVKEELLRVIFHGALHLCGYKDKTKKETFLMRKKEELYLKQFHNKKA